MSAMIALHPAFRLSRIGRDDFESPAAVYIRPNCVCGCLAA